MCGINDPVLLMEMFGAATMIVLALTSEWMERRFKRKPKNKKIEHAKKRKVQ